MSQNSTWRLNEHGKIDEQPQGREIVPYIRKLNSTGYASRTDTYSPSSRKNTQACVIKWRLGLANCLSVMKMSDEINVTRQVLLTKLQDDLTATFMNVSELQNLIKSCTLFIVALLIMKVCWTNPYVILILPHFQINLWSFILKQSFVPSSEPQTCKRNWGVNG
jgi:hypothetical protein